MRARVAICGKCERCINKTLFDSVYTFSALSSCKMARANVACELQLLFLKYSKSATYTLSEELYRYLIFLILCFCLFISVVVVGLLLLLLLLFLFWSGLRISAGYESPW